VTVAYFLSNLGNSLIRIALFAFGIIHTLPYLVVTYTDNGGLQQFLADTLESFLYCIQPLAGQDSYRLLQEQECVEHKGGIQKGAKAASNNPHATLSRQFQRILMSTLYSESLITL
jgi:hypothetical protein